MGKKCCKSHPPCKDCPKRKKKRAISTVDREIWPISYFVPLADISIKGQRGCTEKLPAAFASVPA